MKKRIVCLTLALMMTATQVVSVSASREDELREEQAATSAQLDATYAQIDQLYSAKQQLQDEINSLDANLVNVMVSIQTLEGDISNKEADIQQTQADLQKAQNAKDKQYAAMKQRIQYLYEKGGNEAWFQMMMSADNLSDLLTKAEYTQKMYDYDRQSLEKYANTITQVTNLGNQYQQEKAELEGMKQEYEAQSVDLQNQIDTKKANSADCDNEIAYAQEMANEYANLIQEQQAEIEQLEAERIAAEEEARRQAEAEAAAAAAAAEEEAAQQEQEDQTVYDEDGNEVVRHSSDEEPFSALAFKIMTDPFVGKLAYFRVYSGTMNSGSYVLNATKDKKERVGRILQMHANKRMELDKVYSGDIAAAIGFKFTTTGDTICDDQHPVILESMEFPEPVIELAIEPKTKAGQGKLGEALAKLAEEDPTFRAHTNQETGQTIIAGMGELHLEIIVDRLLREFKVEANVGAPQVAYKETITKAVDIDSKYAKQSGGRGQYGHCKVKFEPMDANGEELYKFESTVVGGAIPKEYIPAVGEGIEEAMKAGILGGFPVVGVHANVYDGSYHEVDSSEMAFHIAGSLAFKDAMQKAAPILLEPIMRVEVTTPEDYMGDVIGDINSRRGRIEGMDDIGGGKMIRGFVPLSEMFGYATDLRSRTQGRGNYSMFFEKYEQVPKSVQEKILSKKD